jgi:hypothetical protein
MEQPERHCCARLDCGSIPGQARTSLVHRGGQAGNMQLLFGSRTTNEPSGQRNTSPVHTKVLKNET